MIKNIIANVFSRIWGFLSVFIFTPFYIEKFGLDQFGIISFYLLLTALLYFLDMGLSAAVNREFARSDNKSDLTKVLSTVEGVYGIIMLIIVFSSYYFPNTILRIFGESNYKQDINEYISWIGLAIALNLFLILYKSALMGMERQLEANLISFLSNLSKYALPFVLFLVYGYSLNVYFIWQVISNVLFIIIYKLKLYKVLGKVEFRVYKFVIRDLREFAFGMMVLASISAVNSQLDKFLALEILGLTMFSVYTVSSSLARIPEVAVSPLTYAVLPRLTRQYAENDMVSYSILLKFISLLLIVSGSLMSVFIITNGELILELWIGNIEKIKDARDFAAILTLGSLFLLMQIPFYLIAVSTGKIQFHRNMGIFIAILVVPLVYGCYWIYGSIGVALPWLILNVIGLIGYILFFVVKLNIGGLKSVLVKTFIVPNLVIFIVQILYTSLVEVDSLLKLCVNFGLLSILSMFLLKKLSGKGFIEIIDVLR